MKPKIIALSGSTRKGSYNKKVVINAVLFLEEAGCHCYK
jgi:NAD(P)H-dependent FMN reductase